MHGVDVDHTRPVVSKCSSVVCDRNETQLSGDGILSTVDVVVLLCIFRRWISGE